MKPKLVHAWYSLEGERQLAQQTPTPAIHLYRRKDGVLVPALKLTPDATPPEEDVSHQGLVHPEPVHAYYPSPYRLPEPGEDALPHLDMLLAQRSWMAVDFLLDVLGSDHAPLPMDSEGMRRLLEEVDTLSRKSFHLGAKPYAHLARTLLLVTPSYLSLLARNTRKRAPWKELLEAGFALVQRPPRCAREHLPLLHAMDCGRRNVQQAAFLLERGEGAPQGASGTLLDRLLTMRSLLYPKGNAPAEEAPVLKDLGLEAALKASRRRQR